jgi:hypothetical protein
MKNKTQRRPRCQKKNTTSKKKAARKRARLAKEETTNFWQHTDERLKTPTTQFTDAEKDTFADYAPERDHQNRDWTWVRAQAAEESLISRTSPRTERTPPTQSKNH